LGGGGGVGEGEKKKIKFKKRVEGKKKREKKKNIKIMLLLFQIKIDRLAKTHRVIQIQKFFCIYIFLTIIHIFYQYFLRVIFIVSAYYSLLFF